MVGVWKSLILLFILFSRWAPNDLDGRVWKSYSLGLYIIYYIYNIYKKKMKYKTTYKKKQQHIITNKKHFKMQPPLTSRVARSYHHHSPTDLERRMNLE
jgi:hypothetical protein